MIPSLCIRQSTLRMCHSFDKGFGNSCSSLSIRVASTHRRSKSSANWTRQVRISICCLTSNTSCVLIQGVVQHEETEDKARKPRHTQGHSVTMVVGDVIRNDQREDRPTTSSWAKLYMFHMEKFWKSHMAWGRVQECCLGNMGREHFFLMPVGCCDCESSVGFASRAGYSRGLSLPTLGTINERYKRRLCLGNELASYWFFYNHYFGSSILHPTDRNPCFPYQIISAVAYGSPIFLPSTVSDKKGVNLCGCQVLRGKGKKSQQMHSRNRFTFVCFNTPSATKVTRDPMSVVVVLGHKVFLFDLRS